VPEGGHQRSEFHGGRQKYGGVMPSEMRRLRQLEEENARPKKPVADLRLDKQCFGTGCQKTPRPARRRQVVDEG